MALRRIDKRAPVPGLNDPVDACGTLFGPFPSEAPSKVCGRLTTTRGEIIDGLVVGSRTPFHLGEGSAGVLSAPLAGNSSSKGPGLVLAYPMPPIETSNETMACELLHELLSDVRTGQKAEGGGTLAGRTLPAVSRAALEASLEARGFTIRKGRATRPRKGVLGHLFADRIVLPPQGTLEDFLALARVALYGLEPDPAAKG
jgi:hypothetical protein